MTCIAVRHCGLSQQLAQAQGGSSFLEPLHGGNSECKTFLAASKDISCDHFPLLAHLWHDVWLCPTRVARGSSGYFVTGII